MQRWTNPQESPVLRETGSWEEVVEKVAAGKQGNVYRQYTVSRVKPESSTITSFYLQPEYSCRSGICQTCATRVIDGEVDYLEPPMVDPEAGMALICSSHPRIISADGNRPLILDL